MWNFRENHLSIFGLLLFGILQGICGVLTDTVKILKTRDSLDLPFQYPIESVISVNWRFNDSLFAAYRPNLNYTFQPSQFSGRLKTERYRVGITVEDLQIQDSGTFRVISFSTETQQPTQTIKVSIQSPITEVQIKSQTWSVSTNSCDVNVMCGAIGAESLSYLWSGYKTASGAHLQFILSPEEGTVTLNCTAANNVSSGSATEKLSCKLNTTIYEVLAGGIPNYTWIVAGGGAALVLLLCLIAAFSHWLRSRKSISAPEETNTVYESVQLESSKHIDQSDSAANGATIYETVEDFRVNQKMTIYSKVTFPKSTTVSATSSSPYQKIL